MSDRPRDRPDLNPGSVGGSARYASAGVHVADAARLVSRLAPIAAATAQPGVMTGVGGFASLFDLGERWRNPVLATATDGVGTKLLLARQVGDLSGLGQDLVAMCVNDVVCTGASPLLFLDYLAMARLNVDEAEVLVAGIARACAEVGASLVGGETAEVPGVFAPGSFELAGFCVGVAERDRLIGPDRVIPGDRLIGLPASGLHSNGFSLVRALLRDAPRALTETVLADGRPLAQALLAPTRLYARAVHQAMARHDLHAAAHITGGGLLGNVPRALPDGLGATLSRHALTLPPVLRWAQTAGDLGDDDLYGVFNGGIGMVLVVPNEHAADCAAGLDGVLLGDVVAGEGCSWIA